jgi:CO/xanthine dehydrogenase FAD-binding subunit
MQAINEYHRPAALAAAVALLARPTPPTRPLAGGTHYRGAPPCEALVDLADLGLRGVTPAGAGWRLGAMTTLADLAQSGDVPPALRRAAMRQAPANQRGRATVGGVTAAQVSGPLLACLLALRAGVLLEPGGQTAELAGYLAGAAGQWSHSLIVGLVLPAGRCAGLAEIARTPADWPLLCVAAGAVVAGGRLHDVSVAAGAPGQPLALCPRAAARLEGAPATGDARPAECDDDIAWRDDARAGAAYRRAMLPVLLGRALADLAAAAGEGGAA